MSTSERRDVVDVVIWGDTGCGKTTWLAALLCGPHRPPWVDELASSAAVRHLQPTYRDLCASRLPAGTTTPTALPIVDRAGRAFSLRDMRGGGAGGVELGPEDCEALASAHALVLVVDPFRPGSATRNIVAAHAALAQFPRDRPVILVLTKVETRLDVAEVAAWHVGGRPIDDYPFGPDVRELVGRVGREDTCLVSVFGYRDDGRPASALDELGREVPCAIRPLFVAEPLERLRARVGARGGR